MRIKRCSQKMEVNSFPFMWIGVGVAIGAGIGAASNNIPGGVGVGIAIGAGLSSMFYLLGKDKKSESRRTPGNKDEYSSKGGSQ